MNPEIFMRFSPISLAAAVASMLILSAPTYGQEKDDIPAPPIVMADQIAEPTRVAEASGRVPVQDAPRTAGKRPCRKPSGELVADRPDNDDEFSSFDKR
jgi:hypothetical protein